MILPAFQSEVDQALKLTRDEMIRDADDVWPRLLAFGEDGKLTYSAIDPGYMSDWRGKNLIGAVIVKACFESRVTIYLSDAFCATPPPGKTFDDMPRNFADWPKSLCGEVLLCCVNARGMMGFFLRHPYTRDGKGRRVFAPEPELQEVRSARFCYDLTEATEEGATLDALFRDREGKLRAES